MFDSDLVMHKKGIVFRHRLDWPKLNDEQSESGWQVKQGW